MARKACHVFASTTRFGLIQALGMPDRLSQTWRLVLVGAGMACLLGCSPPRNGTERQATLISRNQGLEISRKAATHHGYDLSRYTLDTFGDPNAGGEKEWLSFICAVLGRRLLGVVLWL